MSPIGRQPDKHGVLITYRSGIDLIGTRQETKMDEQRLRTLLAEELEKETGLPPGAAEHLLKIRSGDLTPGLAAAIRAMRRVAEEAVVEYQHGFDRPGGEE